MAECINRGHTTQRNYGIDLLRIVSMLMICVLHTLKRGGILDSHFPGFGAYWLAWLMEAGCLCAVNCYALISGYIGIKVTHKYSRLIYLWMTAFFYSFVITLVFFFVQPGTVEPLDIIDSMFPVSMRGYWYFTAYFLLFLFLPLINKGLCALSLRSHRNLVVFLIFAFSIGNTAVVPRSMAFDLNKGYSVWWLLILYIIGAYIRRSGMAEIKRPSFFKWFAVYAVSVLSSCFVKWLYENIGQKKSSGMLLSYQSPTILLCGFSLLMAFSGLKINNAGKKIINFLSPLSFSVYLIHVQKFIFIRVLDKAFKPVAKYPSLAIPFAVLGIAVGIYLICTVIDIGRFYLFKLLRLKKLSEKIADSLSHALNKVLG